MTLFSSPATFSRRYDDAPAKLPALCTSLRISAIFRNWQQPSMCTELQHMDTTWTEFASFSYRIQWDLSANSTDYFRKKKNSKILFYCRLKKIDNLGNAIFNRCPTGAFIFLMNQVSIDNCFSKISSFIREYYYRICYYIKEKFLPKHLYC